MQIRPKATDPGMLPNLFRPQANQPMEALLSQTHVDGMAPGRPWDELLANGFKLTSPAFQGSLSFAVKDGQTQSPGGEARELPARFEGNGCRFDLPNGSHALVYSQYRKGEEPCTLVTSEVRAPHAKADERSMLQMRWEDRGDKVLDARVTVESDTAQTREHAILRHSGGSDAVELDHFHRFGQDVQCDYRLEARQGEWPIQYLAQDDRMSYMGFALEEGQDKKLEQTQALASSALQEHYLG